MEEDLGLGAGGKALFGGDALDEKSKKKQKIPRQRKKTSKKIVSNEN